MNTDFPIDFTDDGIEKSDIEKHPDNANIFN